MATIAATTPRTQATARRRTFSARQIVGKALFWLLVVFIFLYTLFPFYWAVVSALKPPESIGQFPVNYWPTTIDWSSLQYVFENQGFLLSLRNSVIISVSTVLIALTLGAFAAYAMGRMRFRGKNFTLYLILSMTMFPQIAILGALFQTIRRLNLYNTMPALIVTYLTFTLPFTVWVLSNFFKAMPGELEESALVDGSTPFQAFYKILLPLAMPGLITTGLLAFIAAWNEFLFALTFTSTGDFRARTVQPAIASFSGRSQFEEPWGPVMAASVVVTVPLVVLVLIFQRKILGGLTAGAVKG
ncbi:MAG: Maltodextrin ABC transporter, permease protein MdxG [uncultured Thermomicrobiales bacterium]|uniref:Maltodextrin ABC transporter, permease protein MdxG n=1 Tax=uncultured Thermomicrobiales bacterium TaxID=1645740 RepID=A0A6J4UHT3_9BACT|nr:MAG: Maltodextrin ABC transporter, permease protein MdxG [uncultured Thermomicrobiales bacterium]